MENKNIDIVKLWAEQDAGNGISFGEDDFDTFKEACAAHGFEGTWELFNVYLDVVSGDYVEEKVVCDHCGQEVLKREITCTDTGCVCDKCKAEIEAEEAPLSIITEKVKDGNLKIFDLFNLETGDTYYQIKAKDDLEAYEIGEKLLLPVNYKEDIAIEETALDDISDEWKTTTENYVKVGPVPEWPYDNELDAQIDQALDTQLFEDLNDREFAELLYYCKKLGIHTLADLNTFLEDENNLDNAGSVLKALRKQKKAMFPKGASTPIDL